MPAQRPDLSPRKPNGFGLADLIASMAMLGLALAGLSQAVHVGARLQRRAGEDAAQLSAGRAAERTLQATLATVTRDTPINGAPTDFSCGDDSSGGVDRIMDFQAGIDRIDLSRIDANAGLAGDQAFSFVSSFTGAAGQAVLTYDAVNNRTALGLDTDGDGLADFQAYLSGNVSSVSGWLL